MWVILVMMLLGEAPLARAESGLATLMSPAFLKRVVEGREILTRAEKTELAGAPLPPDGPGSVQSFAHSSQMYVRAPLDRAMRFLTDYPGYKSITPYLVRVEYSAPDGLIAFEGKIWSYPLGGVLRVERKGPRWLRFTVLQGHSAGLIEDVFLEGIASEGTLIYVQGGFRVGTWVPVFLVERAYRTLVGMGLEKIRERIEAAR